MIVIKRYPNRKLYDTSVKRYITLDGISDLIREGQEVQVLDHTTGEDLTALTLTQIIFEQEKKNSGFLPRSVLTGLVKAGGETITTLRRTLASPLDMLNQVDEEIERRIQNLIKHGEMAEDEGHRVLDKLVSESGRFLARVITEDDLEKYLEVRGVPTKKDLQKLGTQLDNLAVALEELQAPVDEPDESL
ncbi:MAG: polyhydroxyalkanoate synthesis regulator DNA-binding domain-containing protein [Chloroflexota bacterium]|nr:hypothetical protein [Anaerolineales bacterium]MCB8968410.1 pesticidal protein Cry15Aa [Ardenticatenaceae bacterium]